MAPSKQGQSCDHGPIALRFVPAPHLLRLLGEWRRGNHAYADLAAGVRGLVLDGRLPPGTRLPSERVLARDLRLGRNTVTAALDLLRDQGVLLSRQGSGSWTALPERVARPDDVDASRATLDLTVASLPAPARLAELARAAADDLPRLLGGLGYEPYGLPALRTVIAAYLSERGTPTRPAEVLVTQGALHGLDLVLRTLVRPGERVVVESPTYPAALDAIAGRGARAVPIAVSPEGWDMPLLASTLTRVRPRLAYLVPDFQNPTGALVGAEDRRELLRQAARSGTTVVVDEICADLAIDDIAAPRTPSLRGGADVIALGSLGKVCWGGLRVGWIRARPDLIDRLVRTRSTSDVSGPALDALLAVRVLEVYDDLVAERRLLLAERRDALLGAVERHLPAWRLTARPRGGLCAWLALPAGASSTAIAAGAREAGVLVAPGPRFAAAGGLDGFLRLPFAAPPELDEALARIAALPAADAGPGGATPRWVV